MNLPYHGGTGPLNLLIDSTGIKSGGEGEWNARQHGGPKRRVRYSHSNRWRDWLMLRDDESRSNRSYA